MHITFSGKWAEIKSYVKMLERQGWTVEGDIDSDFVHSTVRMVSEKHSTFSDKTNIPGAPPRKSIVTSKPGAAIRCEMLELTDEERKGLTLKGPMPSLRDAKATLSRGYEFPGWHS